MFSSLDERFKSPDGITGVPTGFADLDSRTAYQNVRNTLAQAVHRYYD